MRKALALILATSLSLMPGICAAMGAVAARGSFKVLHMGRMGNPVSAAWGNNIGGFLSSNALGETDLVGTLGRLQELNVDVHSFHVSLAPVVAQLKKLGYTPKTFSAKLKEDPEQLKADFQTAVQKSETAVRERAGALSKIASAQKTDARKLLQVTAGLYLMKSTLQMYLEDPDELESVYATARGRLTERQAKDVERAVETTVRSWSGTPKQTVVPAATGRTTKRRGRIGHGVRLHKPEPKKKGRKTSKTQAQSPIPPVPKKGKRILTDYDIFRARFGDDQTIKLLKKAHLVENHLNKILFGQPEATRFFRAKLLNYLQTYKTRTKAPAYMVLGGLTGIGKSDLPLNAAKYLEIPAETIGLQNYTGDDEKVPEAFARSLSRALGKFNGKPGILILDELDKVFEIDQHGGEVDRPIMGILNELLSNGKLNYGGEYSEIKGDFSKVFMVITTNFRPRVYGHLEAHPDLTSIDDLQRMHKKVGVKSVDIAEALNDLFRQNTVSRLLPETLVLNPLNEDAYRKLIDRQIAITLERLLPAKNEKSMRMKVTRKFRKFLFQEAIVPATGARETVQSVGHLVESAFGEALLHLREPLAYHPLKLTIDYDDKTGQVIIPGNRSSLNGNPSTQAKGFVVKYAPRLRFAVVPIAPDQKIPEKRLLTAAHEMGHAMAHVRYGVPFQLMRVDPISKEIGGFVKGHQEGDATARKIYADLLIALASRVMESIVYSPKPEDKTISYLQVTGGAASDIYQATLLAVRLISQLGLEPMFGPIARWKKLPNEDEMTQPIPEAMYKRAQEILNRIEEFLVEDLLAAHSREWYIQKIIAVARAGRLVEKEFYRTIGYPYPDEVHYLHDPHRLQPFGDSAASIEKASWGKLRQSQTRTTPEENLDRALKFLLQMKDDKQTLHAR